MLRGERGSVRAVLRPSPARTPHARAARARAPQTARVTARARTRTALRRPAPRPSPAPSGGHPADFDSRPPTARHPPAEHRHPGHRLGARACVPNTPPTPRPGRGLL